MRNVALSRLRVQFALVLLPIIFSAHAGFCQSTFQLSIGADGLEKGEALARMQNGNLLIGGQTASFGLTESDLLLTMMDPQGNLLWSTSYGGQEREVITDIFVTADNQIMLTAEKYRLRGMEGEQLLMLKTNSSGNLLWKKTYSEGDSESEGYSICPTPDGGFLLTGIRKGLQLVSNSFFPMKKENQALYLLKINTNGQKQWSRILEMGANSGNASSGLSLTALPGGDYLIVGDISPGPNATKIEKSASSESTMDSRTMLVLKVNDAGQLLWAREFVGENILMGFDAVALDNGEMVVAGVASRPNSNNVDVLLLGLSSNGRLQWHKTYGGTGFESVSNIVKTNDGGILVNGMTRSFGAGMYDAFLLKTDMTGNVQWSKTYGSANRESTGQMLETDAGYLFTGATINPQTQNLDTWVVQVDKDGNLACGSEDVSFAEGTISIEGKKIQNAALEEIGENRYAKANAQYKKISAENVTEKTREIGSVNLCK